MQYRPDNGPRKRSEWAQDLGLIHDRWREPSASKETDYVLIQYPRDFCSRGPSSGVAAEQQNGEQYMNN